MKYLILFILTASLAYAAFTCPNCGNEGYYYNHVETVDGVQPWCPDCFQRDATQCKECGQWTAKGVEHRCKGANQ